MAEVNKWERGLESTKTEVSDLFQFCAVAVHNITHSFLCWHLSFFNTVEPLYNGHLGDRRKWPL